MLHLGQLGSGIFKKFYVVNSMGQGVLYGKHFEIMFVKLKGSSFSNWIIHLNINPCPVYHKLRGGLVLRSICTPADI